MKKLIILLTALVLVVMTTGCHIKTVTTVTTTTERTEPTEPTIPERYLDKNPLFLVLGDEITVDGVTYTASTLRENSNGYSMLDEDGYFIVNRVNGAVFFVCLSGARGSRIATEYAFDTGLTYTGTVKIADTEFEVPVTTKEGE